MTSIHDEESENFALGDVFTEPARPPSPEPTIARYLRQRKDLRDESDWKEIEVKLVGSHPLWGHYLWNAARAFASFLDDNQYLYKDKNVLELGAGGGLPGIVCALNSARKVILTDYPDRALLENLTFNADKNIPKDSRDKVVVKGYIWGASVSPLSEEIAPSQKFDLLILSDLIFNHSQHESLLKTCEETLDSSPSSVILVFYTHHRPHLAERDLAFFSKAKERGWTCEEIVTEKYPPMFPEDPGEEEVRSTVHGWTMRRTTSS